MRSGLFLLVLITIYAGCKDQQATKPPNILFIYTDDQAEWATGFSGNTQISTPNLDRMAAEGAIFTNAFVTTPVCSPARVSLMTSQYASEYGVYDFIPQIGHRLYDPRVEIGLSPESITFPEVLRGAGYKTGLVGKWHVGIWEPDGPKTYHPTNHGYDYFMGLTGGGTRPKDPVLEKDGIVQQFEGLTCDILTEHVIQFINDNHELPFLLSLHYRAPHAAFLPVADEDWAPYDSLDPEIPNPDFPDLDIEKVKRKMKEYMASISGVDRNVGRILEHLEKLGLSDNTIIIFTSDHGYNMGHNGIEHKGNGYWITKTEYPASGNLAKNSRPNMYDNSLRVPAIIKWPGIIEPGTTIKHLVTSLDWYPTLIEMANTSLPENQVIRGRSLVPLLQGKEPQWDQDLYAEYSMINYSKAYMRTYRTPEWKLTLDLLNPGRHELYHLSVDPEETKNLINSNDEQVRTVIGNLSEKIYARMQKLSDTLSLPGAN